MRHLNLLATAATLCLCLGSAALAQTGGPAQMKTIGQASQPVQTGPVPSLFVLNADGATLKDGKLTLTGVSPNSIVFSDRPFRSAGHLETKQFIETWAQGEDSFGIDPPNATISLLDGSTVSDAVVTISAPVLEANTLTFKATVLEGSLDGAKGAAALFIDDRGGGGGGGGARAGGGDGGGQAHFQNYSQVQDPHAAYYKSNDTVGSDDTVNRTVNVDGSYGGYPVGAGAVGVAAGAAVGAAAANRWDGGWSYPTCGYPPYPPCN